MQYQSHLSKVFFRSGIYYDEEVPCCLNPKNTGRYLETSVLAQFGFTIEQLQSLYTIDLRLLVLAAERGGREGGSEGGGREVCLIDYIHASSNNWFFFLIASLRLVRHIYQAATVECGCSQLSFT